MKNTTQKGFANILAIIIAVLVIGGAIYLISYQRPATNNDAETAESSSNESMMMEDNGNMNGAEIMGDAMNEYSGSVLAGNSSPLLDFVKSDYDAALESDKLVVLYFYANWCPICKQEVRDAFYPAFNELEGNEVIGFRINYNDNETDDNEKNLAREFGIAYQHTKVFLKHGERILKSPEGWDKNRYISEINKVISTP